jgi:hypothetical protein
MGHRQYTYPALTGHEPFLLLLQIGEGYRVALNQKSSHRGLWGFLRGLHGH